MGRCFTHRIVEPCPYCKKGIPTFATEAAHLDAIEARLIAIERRQQLEAMSPEIEDPDGLQLSQAIAVIRDYALGDLVMLSASLRALKQKNSERPLVLVTRQELGEVLDGADYLDAVLPKQTYENANFYQVHDLCHAAETECGGKLSVKKYLTKSRPDVFAELLGVEGGAKNFPIVVNQEALRKMLAITRRAKKPIIGVAPTCNSLFRVMPPEYVEPLVNKILESYGGTVILVGKTTNWTQHLSEIRSPGVLNLINLLTVKELVAVCSLMDAMVSPDTGTMHVAGALGVKCLCLMGNNDPKIFSDFYPSVLVLQPTAKELPCAPCNDRSIPCTPLPQGQYGAECMQIMTPERVHKALLEFYNGLNIAYLHDTPLTFIGGAEITTKGMIKAGQDLGFNIKLFDNTMPAEKLHDLYQYDLVILSNIWRFSPQAMSIIMDVIRSVPYVKYEHDHDGLGDKALGIWPKAEYAEKIYGNSALNIFVSPAHMADYAALGGGICIPELIDTEMFVPVKGIKRKPNSVLVAIPGKWDRKVLDDYIKKNPDLKVDVLDRKVPHEDMPALYSQYETLAHFPAKKWPCDRVIFEAALCGCKIVANGTKALYSGLAPCEALSWEKDLADQKSLRTWLKQVPDQFWSEISAVIERTTIEQHHRKSAAN